MTTMRADANAPASGCLLCGSAIVYESVAAPVTCALCSRTEQSEAHCDQGHFVCDACHRGNAPDVIERACIASDSINPIALAHSLLSHGSVKMHGPEHHFLVPAVLLATTYNALGKPAAKADAIHEARRRADKVPGGFCGTHGNCGAGVGTGIFASVMTGATPLSTEGWKLANTLTARSLLRIAQHGGPRCCKRDTALAILEAAEVARQLFGAQLEIPARIQCPFHDRNQQCLKGSCPFFPPA